MAIKIESIWKWIAAASLPFAMSCAGLSQIDDAAPAPETVQRREEFAQTLNLHIGARSLDSEAVGEVDDHSAFGLVVQSQRKNEPFGYEVALLRSTDSETGGGTELRSTLTEMSFGFSGLFELPADFIVIAGAGLAAVLADAEVITGGEFDGDNDVTPGFYAHVGAAYMIPDTGISVGIDYRQLMFTDVDFGGDGSGDVDYGQITGFVGWSF